MPRISSHPVTRLSACAALCVACTAGAAAAAAAAVGSDFNDRDNILIADQFNNRVIEIEPLTHHIVWQFGDGADQPGPHSVVGTNDAERLGPYTLISGTGTPPSDPPLPGCHTATGCPDNRVLIVDPAGRIIWQYGPAELNTPVQATFVSDFPRHPGFHVLITDQGNQRVILVDLFTRKVDWQYGTGTAGAGHNQLNSPNSAELLKNGRVLIADEGNNRAIEVDVDLNVRRQFTAGGTINGAAFASRLPNGRTLITDSNNNRIVEVDAWDTVVWQYKTNLQPGSNPAPLPTRAVRLRNGDTLISDQFNQRVLQVNHAGHIVFQHGALNQPGSGETRLNGPYDAKQIGDYTGLTPPFDFEFPSD